MAGNWFKLHRQIIKSQVWANSPLLKLWIWCLARANWEETWMPMKTGRGRTQVHLLPGQFVFGRKKAAKFLKMTEGGLRYRMAKLEGMGNIKVESATHYSIISVCNWETYQMCPDKNNQPTANQPPTNRQPTATEKKSIRRSKKVEEDTVRARGPTYSDAFESFWGVVAPHKRKSKAEAFRRYREATSTLKPREADPATFLLDRATAYYSSALGQTPYCNGPAPWLNKGGYDDDPAAWERKGDTHSKQGAGQVHPSDNLDEEGTF